MVARKFYCTFPQALIREPIISHLLNAKFGVIPNIRAASITEQQAMVSVEIEGEDLQIDNALDYLRERGVQTEELSEDDPRGH